MRRELKLVGDDDVGRGLSHAVGDGGHQLPEPVLRLRPHHAIQHPLTER